MATLDEVYGKIVSDDAEKKAFAEAFATEGGAAAFMEERGCEASPAELVAFLRGKAETGETPDGELEGAAGGTSNDWAVSLFGVGLACEIRFTISTDLNFNSTANSTGSLCKKL